MGYAEAGDPSGEAGCGLCATWASPAAVHSRAGTTVATIRPFSCDFTKRNRTMPQTPKLEELESRLIPSVSATFGLGPGFPGVFRNGTWFLDTNGNRSLDAGDATFVYGLP